MLKSKSHKKRGHANDVLDMLAPHMDSAREKAAPVIADAKLRAADARVKAAPYVAEAREKAAPYVAEARERTSPAIEGARTKLATEVLPVLTAAVAAASEATEEARGEAKRRGLATAAALKGELEPPKETHRLRSLLILLGLTGIAALVAKKLSDREASTAWQSSYSPTPASPTDTASAPTYSAPGVSTPAADDTPMGTAAAAAAAAHTHDEGAAGPDEAASDATDVPHPATTPENPAEEIDIDKRS